jgi:hypothetical protein
MLTLFLSKVSLSPVNRVRRPRLTLTLLLGILVCALWLALPSAAHAQDGIVDPEPNTKPCSSCHSEEAEAWDASPHGDLVDPETGHALATCTTCHGEYVRGHPDEDSIPLVVDSSSCKDCHEETWSQWENSIHGAEGVQCISCHLVHSLEMRISDDRLCTSCHRESLDDTLHQAHWTGTATCTDCHMASDDTLGQSVVTVDNQLIETHGSSHDFVSVSASKCLDCHREDVNNPAGSAETAQTIAAVDAFAPELEQAQQVNRTLGVLSLANLGFGIGIGGILGIIFMIAYARFGSRRTS